ncbi:cytochrome c-type protein torC [Escherichia coli]|nr:cytochrome c-type protein torC [Escherichia coli]
MSSGFRKQFDELRASANDSGDTLYSIDIKPIYAAKGDKEASGSLLPASEVKVLKRDGDWLQIEITGWTESAGRQRVLTQFPGKRIFVASIRGDVQQQVKNAGENHRCRHQYRVEQVAGHCVDEERRHGERYQTDLGLCGFVVQRHL